MRFKKTLVFAAVFWVLVSGCKKKELAGPVEQKKPVAAETVFGPVVAGAFYPGDAAELKTTIEKDLSAAKTPELPGRLIGVMSPHAGYQYSGPVAAYAYKAVQASGKKKFVIIAPSHHYPGAGMIAALDADYYQTPLGKVKINRDKVKQLLAKGGWVRAEQAYFAQEHSAEVQIPFLQVAAGNDIEVVLIVMPDPSPEIVKMTASALKEIFSEPDWVFIASSDMSHYHPDAEAKKMDARALKLIEKLDFDQLAQDALGVERKCELCGIGPVLAVISLVKSMQEAKATVLAYKNSFDTTGQNPERVVGYGAVAFTVKAEPGQKSGESSEAEELQPPGGPLTLEEKKELMRIARLSVETIVRENKKAEVSTNFPRLKERGAAFVTLNEHGQLRGCIGHILAIEPLYLCVRDVAADAAKRDPRFAPVRPNELDKLEYEISVLSPMARVKDLNTIEVGKDGLLMRSGYFQGVLLPQVPVEYGWSREEFLAHTCNKAGMNTDCWTKPEVEIFHFRGIVFAEKDLK